MPPRRPSSSASVALTVQVTQTLAQERAAYARLAGQQEIVFEVVDSPESRRVLLRPAVSGSTAYGKIFTRPDLPFVVAMAARLQQPPPGHAYHLWIRRGAQDTLLGVLLVNQDGFGSLVYVADTNGPSFENARLTLQPTGTGTPQGFPVLISSN